MPIRIHLVALPHIQLTKDKYGQDANGQKVRKFADMMTSLGYEVFIYGPEEAECKGELITCITKAKLGEILKDADWFKKNIVYKIPFDAESPLWKYYLPKVIKELKKRVKTNDVICLSAGYTMRDIIRTFPYITCEYGIGYYGAMAKFRVFESQAVANFIYSRMGEHIDRRYDEVIPNFFEVDDFPFIEKKDDYLLYMSRPILSKGLAWVKELAKSHRVIAAGAEKIEGLEWVGYADPKKRAELMGNAKALLCPTQHIAPFDGVVVEANLCGTPAITTNWGAFVENIKDGISGIRVHTYDEFKQACEQVDRLSPKDCRAWAMQYSTDRVKYQYDAYFKRLSTYFKKGAWIMI